MTYQEHWNVSADAGMPGTPHLCRGHDKEAEKLYVSIYTSTIWKPGFITAEHVPATHRGIEYSSSPISACAWLGNLISPLATAEVGTRSHLFSMFGVLDT